MRMGARSFPIEYYILRIAGPSASQACAGSSVVGYLGDRPIFSTVVDSSGTCYRYVGLALRLPDGRYDVQSLAPGEWIVGTHLQFGTLILPHQNGPAVTDGGTAAGPAGSALLPTASADFVANHQRLRWRSEHPTAARSCLARHLEVLCRYPS